MGWSRRYDMETWRERIDMIWTCIQKRDEFVRIILNLNLVKCVLGCEVDWTGFWLCPTAECGTCDKDSSSIGQLIGGTFIIVVIVTYCVLILSLNTSRCTQPVSQPARHIYTAKFRQCSSFSNIKEMSLNWTSGGNSVTECANGGLNCVI